ncbi:transmembrane protein 179-like [Clavelina lepadiformis]|uniref:transmembrane protein 179-like n=1 Tax=Clavelina lepadiformis TaxID=159417 RepID=UPI004042E295
MNPNPKIFLIVYGISFFLSFFVVVPVGISVADFNGYCLLYAKGNFTLNSDSSQFSSTFHLIDWGPSGVCNFILYMGITILVFSTVLIWRTGLLVWKGHDRSPFTSFVIFVSNGVIMFMTFVAAVMNLVGYDNWCGALNQVASNVTCDKSDLTNLDERFNIHTERFQDNFSATQFGLWGCFCTWLLGTIFAFFKVYYYHKHDDLLQSLAFEKATLLNRRFRYQQVDSTNDLS